ncbi:UxaA family hydrolase [Granulicella sp. L46]|uniref:UxaA family hydrolase n=1 Tax=Granulicella sp. L46 TaxID=1641865 RepID=UPI00131D0F71|nr:UxaA family hydrolase [Granulicella sp. L46]
MKQCFSIHPKDNVATLTEDADSEPLLVVGSGGGTTVQIEEAISLGHKVALAAIAPDAVIIKYGVIIGVATKPIERGGWVHLHNCRSLLDDRSQGLDLRTGIPKDTPYE